ncbi:transcriptional regulator [Aureimonas ureilytica]|uniref:Transcriptional regulator n=1 Tax=Aureimonas ureilytica TaxID=401562 RepID=A0A175RFY9_9HYPH|nr:MULTISPECIES: transcriptional regulator [Aureimonas]KTQ91799.1 transcriptional regulator [Aureimonas ureilytica]KTR02193.1 transcriptional regulator [Aureimonas ureilytica]
MPGSETSAPFAYDGLDRVIHEKARLGVMTSLAGQPKGLGFADLKRLCGLTDGNLSRHLQVLEEAGFVRIDKSFSGKRPVTTCFLTEKGRKSFLDYLAILEQVVRDAASASKRGQTDLSPKPA